MKPMVLEVKVREPVKSGTDRTQTFEQSPVRIGRNQLNDVHLDDPFVSSYHGIVRFDATGMAYFDLGSTNGTMMAGKRLAKNVPVALTPESRISIGRIDLTFVQRWESGSQHTLGWGQLSTVGPVTPPPPERAAMAAAAAPRAADPPAPRPDHAASEDVAARRERILEALAEAFIGLKNGYEQFGLEVGVRTLNGMTPLHKARTSRDVLSFLLSPTLDPSAAIHDLISIFADFGIHHIAMMEGVTEGTRSLLQSLDPRTNGLDASLGILSKARHRELWSAYLERFDQMLSDGNELHAGIFGDDFARAYASVTTGDRNGGEPRGSRDDSAKRSR